MDIIFIGGHSWNGPWFRKQQFAKRLADSGHRVFYIEDSISLIRWNKNKNNHPYRIKIKEISKNLIILTPPTLLPFPLNIISRSIYNFLFFLQLNSILKRYKATDSLLWFNRMEYSTYLKHFKGKKIFDLCDDLPGYSLLRNNYKSYNRQLFYLKKALKYCNISVVSAVKIFEKYKHLTIGDMIIIPNGHNISGFSFSGELPSDMNNINKPVIGFIGTLFQFIDDNLLQFIITKRPNYNFVFVGNIENGFPIEQIRKYPNVFLLGRKPQKEINAYIQAFDLCINPFKVHEVNDSVSPVKVFEYLANKKHVVSTSMYSLRKERISEYITFADTSDEFLTKIDEMVGCKENYIPQEVLQRYHWDNLFGELISEVNSKLNLSL